MGDDVAKSKRMAAKEAYIASAVKAAAAGPKKVSLAEKKIEMAAHAALTAAQAAANKKSEAYKARLKKVSIAAHAAARAQWRHGRHLKRTKALVDRQYKALKLEQKNDAEYTVTDNLHHPDAFLQLGEQQDGDTMANMKKALAQTKKDAAKEVAQAQQNAVLAISKVKSQVEALKAQQKSTMELSKKREISAVRHVAAKAMMAVNAAKLAGALGKAGAPAKADEPKVEKSKLVQDMRKARIAAMKAANTWKVDAMKLAVLEKSNIQKMKVQVEAAKASTNHAGSDVKLATKITEMFKANPNPAP